ncbi:uncharacterized protein LOC18432038 [Amborella trichopoda]|uniref:uncharacterized protein LOC18432038 n=1 Tax=Amborella trichopoda TaxID=13333 RepID=UPI0005D37306|nr:uncharacterized protein LOC18432038 [Amborella trichopoda]|eukprot:XP_011622538.1 uncharacterized protein LOC18432038 [Amborella trichopoda]
MAKKRKSEVTGLDEVDRKMHTTFCNAANSLSLLYTHAQNQQKLAFLAGERHGMDKLCQWIIRQHNEGARVTEADILAYLENELDIGEEDAPMSIPSNSQSHPQSLNPSTPTFSGPTGQLPSAQTKSSLFSNALSSPIRRSLHSFQLAHCSDASPNTGGRRTGPFPEPDHHGGFNGAHGLPHDSEISTGDPMAEVYPHQPHENRDCDSKDSLMDMHEESPFREYY